MRHDERESCHVVGLGSCLEGSAPVSTVTPKRVSVTDSSTLSEHLVCSANLCSLVKYFDTLTIIIIKTRPNRGNLLTLLTINIGTSSPLLRLLLEIRLKIYNYAFDNSDSNNATKSRVYVIKERRSRRLNSSTKLRKNLVDLDNATRRLMALEKTCRQVRNEIREMVVPASF